MYFLCCGSCFHDIKDNGTFQLVFTTYILLLRTIAQVCDSSATLVNVTHDSIYCPCPLFCCRLCFCLGKSGKGSMMITWITVHQRNQKSFPRVDSSVPLIHYDPNDLESMIHFRIFPKKCTLILHVVVHVTSFMS